jgi:hypothetical protein
MSKMNKSLIDTALKFMSQIHHIKKKEIEKYTTAKILEKEVYD